MIELEHFDHTVQFHLRNTAVLVTRLFDRLFADISQMPAEWCEGLEGAREDKRARRVADYIAGMTDTFAINEHRRLFGTAPDLR